MSGISVRDARDDDVEGFVRAYEAAWNAGLADIIGAELETFLSFEAQVQAFHAGRAKASPDARILVAERAGKIVGVASCRREGTTGELVSLYVVPESWGTGAGQQLHDVALAAMRGDVRAIAARPRARRRAGAADGRRR